MSALPNTIPHDVETKTHLVAVLTRVEEKGENGGVLSVLSICLSLAKLRDFPNHRSVMVAVLYERAGNHDPQAQHSLI